MPKFKTKLHQTEGLNATGVVVSAKIVEALGAGKKPPVNVTINGKYSYRGRVSSVTWVSLGLALRKGKSGARNASDFIV